ncbi:hypothetical protein [Streptomyces sp. NPDC050738]|uniref:hypothetical protein n=1 Tax=Streptomyces sp. NPDC050738 TaxID=3154744 RepID=UPI003434CB64
MVRRGIRDNAWIGLPGVTLAIVASVGGCAALPETQQAGSTPRVGAVRHEEEPVERRFPEFGEVVATVWVAEELGVRRSSVPGPTDIRLVGSASLLKPTVRRILRDFVWRETSMDVALPDGGIAKELRTEGEWVTSPDFDQSVTRGSYTGRFYLNAKDGVMLFDAVNPTPPAES